MLLARGLFCHSFSIIYGAIAIAATHPSLQDVINRDALKNVGSSAGLAVS